MTSHCDLIIGGTRGLGRELADRWSGTGATVHIAGRRPPAGGLSPQQQFWPVDLAQKAAVSDFCDRFKAGRPAVSRLVFAQRCARPESIEQELQVAVLSTVQIIDAISPLLSSEACASILLVGSLASHHISLRQGVGYHLAKAALPQVARYYAWKLGPANVRINVLSPCYFLKADQEQPPTELRALLELGPMAGCLRSTEILDWIDFLTTRANSGVTGQVIEIDRGASLLDPESRRLGAPPTTTP